MRRVNQLSDPPGSQARQWSNIKIVLVERDDDDDEEVCRMKIRRSMRLIARERDIGLSDYQHNIHTHIMPKHSDWSKKAPENVDDFPLRSLHLAINERKRELSLTQTEKKMQEIWRCGCEWWLFPVTHARQRNILQCILQRVHVRRYTNARSIQKSIRFKKRKK